VDGVRLDITHHGASSRFPHLVAATELVQLAALRCRSRRQASLLCAIMCNVRALSPRRRYAHLELHLIVVSGTVAMRWR
jgi:hypothetical protein